MIALDRLQQIIPADQALANKALATSLQQLTGISIQTLPTFSNVVANMETTRDLPLITALQTPVPTSVANYYKNTLAKGHGPNGSILITDILGLAGGWVATDAFTGTVAIFKTMDLTYLTLIYQTMADALNGDYGPADAGPIIIPPGYPGAGTYIGTEIPPEPPDVTPTYDPTAIDLAMAVLISDAQAEIIHLTVIYPTQTTELNTLWDNMAVQVETEQTLQPIANIDFATLTDNVNSVYSLIYSLPNYGNDTQVGGMAWFIEAVADITTFTGQAVIACLRQGRNAPLLSSVGIQTTTTIPVDPNPPPEQAVLIPSTYSATEAANVVIK